MKWYLKLVVIYVMRIIIRILYIILPLKKNRILFSAHSGQAYKCNPKYIFQYLYHIYGDQYEYIWAINSKDIIPAEYKITCVRYLSLKHLYYLITSAVIVGNVSIEPFMPPRKDRIFINTWHGGGAYKKSALSASYYSKAHRQYFKAIRNLRAKSTDYIISSNNVFSNVMSEFFNVSCDKMLSIGMPRNDVFFEKDEKKEAIRSKVRKELKLDKNQFLLLYAPTYRGHEHSAKNIDWVIDVLMVNEAVKKRFGKDVLFMYRCHMNMKNHYQSLSNAMDVSDYPDMQELLLVADMIISDYSSFIWDYALTYKPGFLYTPDLADYMSDVQFYTPIEQWQYPYALTNERLCSLILEYEESSAVKKINNHLSLLGSYEKGVASKTICDLIVKHIDSMQ